MQTNTILRREGERLPPPRNLKEARVRELISFYRGIILDGLEINYGDQPSWGKVRGMVLKVFGDTGMEARLREIMSVEEIKLNG